MWVQKAGASGVEGIAFAPDGAALYALDRSGWVTAWDLLTHAGNRRFHVPPRSGQRVRLSALPGGRLFVLNGSALLFNTTGSGSRLPDPFAERYLSHDAARLYARGDEPGTVATWDLRNDRRGPELSGWHLLGDLRTFRVGPDGRTAVLTDTHGYVSLYDLDAGREAARFEPRFSGWTLDGAALAPDGNTLLVAAGPRAQFWDAAGRSLLGEEVLGLWPPYEPTFNPRLPVFAAQSRDGLFTLYRLPTGEPVRALDFQLGAQVLCAAFSPDGLTCAIGGSNRQFAVFDVDL